MAYPVRARQTLAVKAQLKGPVEASLVVVATLEEAGNMASPRRWPGMPGYTVAAALGALGSRSGPRPTAGA